MRLLAHCFPSPVLLLLFSKGQLSKGFSSQLNNLNCVKSFGTIKDCSRTQITKMSSTSNNNDTTSLTDSQNQDPPSETNDQQQLIFGKFKISPSQIFYHSPSNLSAAIVNLRPIVPGHVLIIPKRIVPKISQLETNEYIDLWDTARIVQNMLEQHHDAQGFNIAIQDGKAAGQSVPHVHVHILPRIMDDFERNDDIYDKLEDWAPTDELVDLKLLAKEGVSGNYLDVPDDKDRRDRTMQQMEDEAIAYRTLLLDSQS